MWDPEDYDSWHEEEPGRTLDLIETDCLMSLLFPIGGKDVLDVGCGTGNFVGKLARLGYHVVGLEPDRSMRDRALKKGLRCVEGRAEEIPFPDGSFDAILSVTALEFFEDKEKAFSEMFRVLREGGKIVLGTLTGRWREFYEERGREGHPVFSKASFPDLEFLISVPGFSKLKTCLFSGPGEAPSFERERLGGDPGFLCLLYFKRGV